MGAKEYQDDIYRRDSLGVFEACDALLLGPSTYDVFARIYSAGGGNPAG